MFPDSYLDIVDRKLECGETYRLSNSTVVWLWVLTRKGSKTLKIAVDKWVATRTLPQETDSFNYYRLSDENFNAFEIKANDLVTNKMSYNMDQAGVYMFCPVRPSPALQRLPLTADTAQPKDSDRWLNIGSSENIQRRDSQHEKKPLGKAVHSRGPAGIFPLLVTFAYTISRHLRRLD